MCERARYVCERARYVCERALCKVIVNQSLVNYPWRTTVANREENIY